MRAHDRNRVKWFCEELRRLIETEKDGNLKVKLQAAVHGIESIIFQDELSHRRTK